MIKLTSNIFVVLIQLAVLSTADNLTSTTETTVIYMKSTTQMTPLTTVMQETEQNIEKSDMAKTTILRIEPEEQETAKIVDILMEQIIEKEKQNNGTQGNWAAVTENTLGITEVEKETLIVENSTISNINLIDSNIQKNSEMNTPGKISDTAELEQKLPDEQIDSSSAIPPSTTSRSRESEVQENANKKSRLVNIIVEQAEPSQPQQSDLRPPISLAQPFLENGFREQAKLNIEDTDSKQVLTMEESTTSILEHTQAIPVVLTRASDFLYKVKNEISDAHVETESKIEKRDEHMKTNEQQVIAASEPQVHEKPSQVTTERTNTDAEKVEETTPINVEKTEKPSLLERMKHNRHRKFKSEEEEDKSEGPVPCTCGVFLSGQFKKGSKQQPKGMPVLTQEMDTPFMNNAVGNRQCTNKCLELIIKHLPKSSEIICATVDRENVFKERAYLFVKNHSDKWHGTNLSAGREFCCKDNTPYKCPVGQ